MEWKPYVPVQHKQVLRFLEDEEPVSISCASRVLESEKRFVLSARPGSDESLYLGTEQGRLSGLVYCRTFGLVHPLFRKGFLNHVDEMFPDRGSSRLGRDSSRLGSDAGKLEMAIRRSAASGIAGRRVDVELMEALCPEARARTLYRYMFNNKLLEGSAGAMWTVRPAVLGDFRELVSIEAAYQREEVLSPVHDFSMSACEASVRLALAKYRVLVAESGGRIVARAQVNGIGARYEQIGGVYVWPEFRGRGAGRTVTAALVREISSRGKAPALFVKMSNEAAIKLYLALGFEDLDEFAIHYF